MTINRDDHGETDRGFGSSDGDGENCDHDAGRLCRLRSEPPKRDEIQIRRREHHLDPDEDKDRVTPAERGEQSDAKQAAETTSNIDNVGISSSPPSQE